MEKNKFMDIFNKEIWLVLMWLYVIVFIVIYSNKSNIETTPRIETYRAGDFYEECIFKRPSLLEDRNEIKTEICKLQNKTDIIIERINDKSDSRLNLFILFLSFLGALSSYIQYENKS